MLQIKSYVFVANECSSEAPVVFVFVWNGVIENELGFEQYYTLFQNLIKILDLFDDMHFYWLFPTYWCLFPTEKRKKINLVRGDLII